MKLLKAIAILIIFHSVAGKAQIDVHPVFILPSKIIINISIVPTGDTLYIDYKQENASLSGYSFDCWREVYAVIDNKIVYIGYIEGNYISPATTKERFEFGDIIIRKERIWQ